MCMRKNVKMSVSDRVLSGCVIGAFGFKKEMRIPKLATSASSLPVQVPPIENFQVKTDSKQDINEKNNIIQHRGSIFKKYCCVLCHDVLKFAL